MADISCQCCVDPGPYKVQLSTPKGPIHLCFQCADTALHLREGKKPHHQADWARMVDRAFRQKTG